MIETHDLSKNFDGFQAVDGVSLSVQAGEVLALLGPNGAGKTTTIRMLTSVLRPTRGTANVAGHDVVANAAQVRASVGVLTEQHGLYNRMPGDEYLDFFGQVYGMDTTLRLQRVDELLADFGLESDRQRRIAEYSKGMRQKLALARALLHNPPVLLLDEPTSAMDPESALLVRNAIKDLRSAERAIVICTHNLAEAEELADKIAIIRRGKIIANDSPRSLKQMLLGPGEYEVRFTQPLGDSLPTLPKNVTLQRHGYDWLRFQSEKPDETNPLILQSLMEQGFPVLSLHEIPRSLEQVYLEAINTTAEEGAEHAG